MPHTSHESSICVTWLIHTCDMTHSYAWHGSFKRMTCDILNESRHTYWRFMWQPWKLWERHARVYLTEPSAPAIPIHTHHYAYTATHSNTLQHTRMCMDMALLDAYGSFGSIWLFWISAPALPTHINEYAYTATRCNTLQHAATHCNTPQNTATNCNTRKRGSIRLFWVYLHNVLQCVTMCCSVLQCVAACCSLLQDVAVYCTIIPRR